MLQVLAFADDLTGALEAGAHFAGQGLPALVTVEQVTGSHPVHVIDTESRHLPPPAAAEALLQFAGADAPIVYKKTDSSLRGNIAAELTLLQDIFANRTVSYIPAYPALGRTVRDGHLFVNGIPVHRTEFATDLLNPVPDSSIQRLLTTLKHVAIYDGETQADVANAVAAALRHPASAHHRRSGVGGSRNCQADRFSAGSSTPVSAHTPLPGGEWEPTRKLPPADRPCSTKRSGDDRGGLRMAHRKRLREPGHCCPGCGIRNRPGCPRTSGCRRFRCPSCIWRRYCLWGASGAGQSAARTHRRSTSGSARLPHRWP